jgi:hypothetical protein
MTAAPERRLALERAASYPENEAKSVVAKGISVNEWDKSCNS